MVADSQEPRRAEGASRSDGLRALAARRPLYLVGALALLVLLGVQLASLASQELPTWGWDESMHAELPAARTTLHLARGEARAAAEVVLECQQYPFVFPLVLAAAQLPLGVSESVARGTALLFAYGVGLLALVLLGLEIARALWDRGRGPAPLGALLLVPIGALASPLFGRYAPTLFLEVPFLVVSAFALRAWLMRRAREAPLGSGVRERRELAAGAWVMAAFFTKFNYGALLGAALVLDWLAEALAARRAGLLGAHARAGLWLAVVPVLGFLWWFVLPLPGGLEVASAHREAFAGFLAGNLEMAAVPWARRLLDWYGGVAPHPALLLVLVGFVLASLRRMRRPVTRTFWIVLVVTGLPVWLHPFHLDRFLLPSSLAIWCLAAIGAAGLPPARDAWQMRLSLATGLAALAVVGAVWWKYPITRFADRLGLLARDPAARAGQEAIIRERWRLGGTVETAGLARAEADALYDLIAGAVGPEERVGWLGQSSEVSPAALHLALLERGESVERFLADAPGPMDVTPVPGEVRDVSSAELAAWVAQRDVVLLTDPPDLKARPSRAAVRERWHVPLTELGWLPTRVGIVTIAGREVAVYASRRP